MLLARSLRLASGACSTSSSSMIILKNSRNFLGTPRYYSTPATRNGRPFRLAVIGSGPAGFYTAYRAMSRIQDARVDMYEALPVPFGLVRFGVAPDHPEVKVGIFASCNSSAS
jgi:hypothetical protein